MSDSIYKVTVTVPEDSAELLMDAISEVNEQPYPGYERVFTVTDVTGTWIPVYGSHPAIGEEGVISRVAEKKLEFIVKEENLKRVLQVIDEYHPYEEPGVDVIPCRGWRSYL